ncbi:hypothetical protein N657DRAFT_674591 [Parathielavia appendiculata]|uniref:Uncharacterized protein n=1 Tax=Parathielavia appendiculata TaxID=2587402 RepID=A0AAN6TTU7_9PEZI|nr:hypothetical protein N657DRAFT_674591 [Parathielavia appendiculata]
MDQQDWFGLDLTQFGSLDNLPPLEFGTPEGHLGLGSSLGPSTAADDEKRILRIIQDMSLRMDLFEQRQAARDSCLQELVARADDALKKLDNATAEFQQSIEVLKSGMQKFTVGLVQNILGDEVMTDSPAEPST